MLTLFDDERLRSTCHEAEKLAADPSHYAYSWREQLAAFLTWVRDAGPEQRASLDFQKKLWNDNPVTGTGMGSVRVDDALANRDFRAFVAEIGALQLPDEPTARQARLEKVHKDLLQRVSEYSGRKPRLKILRLLAAFFPGDFTSVASGAQLRALHDALIRDKRGSAVALNLRITSRISEVLGEPGRDVESLARRMTLPWLVYDLATVDDDDALFAVDEGSAGSIRLKPLPALRRKKGLTAVGRAFPALLDALGEVDGGISRDDFIEYRRAQAPGSKTSSHAMFINILRSEFGVIRQEGSLYRLTPIGEEVLETADPDPMAEYVLTRILGVDHLIHYLRVHGPTERKELLSTIQAVNPGWSTSFMPSAIIGWLRSFDVVEKTPEGEALTERGRTWAELIDWVPESLEPVPSDDLDVEEEAEVEAIATPGMLEIPALQTIERAITEAGVVLESGVVRDLHAGLNLNPRRHFAVLAGLSGTGKSLLARKYGEALVGGPDAAKTRVEVVPVQPGWYDPGALLGYPNPVKPDEYVRTPFLNFVLRAVQEPTRPHVVILDEMNLSHPEQYMAPLLSAMEGDERSKLKLHAEGTELDGVAERIPYPANLFIIGTINMDETTHGLSDKVLDRAFVLEFWRIDLDAYPHWETCGLDASGVARVRGALGRLLTVLEPGRLHFGWRVVDDVLGFLRHAGDVTDATLDAVVYAKVLPKLRGEDTERFRTALQATGEVLRDEKLPRCAAKLGELQHDLETTGSARFWR